jgi:polysaccharide pyruvyl transferase WcaK-like protein
MHNLKPRLTQKDYAIQQIQKYLDEAVVYESQIRVITKTLGDDSKKDNAMKALTALNEQVKAGKEALSKWEEFYEELEKEEQTTV